MKDYLAEFTSAPEVLRKPREGNHQNHQKVGRSFEKGLGGEPSKPSKGADYEKEGAFDGFDGDLPSTFSNENIEMHDSALMFGEGCPVCYAPLCEEIGKQFIHRWCEQPGHFDSWRAEPGYKLGDALRRGE